MKRFKLTKEEENRVIRSVKRDLEHFENRVKGFSNGQRLEAIGEAFRRALEDKYAVIERGNRAIEIVMGVNNNTKN